MTDKYDDIIGLPHPTSDRYPRMPLAERAAQFSPFAALTGYDSVISETARLTDRRVELDENRRQELDTAFSAIQGRMDEHPEVLITYFKEDMKKEGGEYVDISGRLKKIDLYTRTLILENGMAIPVDDIYSLSTVLSSAEIEP
ncbi:MAG: hypothetical protein IJ840_02220 [Bacteroidales bacterium]|nr:hypothetical protein [Bacteroidales bacterium]